MSATSWSGWASPSSPMVAVTRPGYRSSSSSSGVDDEEPAHRRGDRDLARPGEALQARRHRRARPQGRHVAADHRGALVVVGDRQEQRGVGCCGRRRRVRALPPGPLRAPLLGRLAGQAEQQQHDADGDAERRDREPQQRLPSTGDGQPQAESEGHGDAIPSPCPRASTPSRTSTVRSAYAATRRLVRHHQDAGALLASGVDEQLHDLVGRDGVERARGLVGEHDRRVRDQRPCHRNPLALTSGELAG